MKITRSLASRMHSFRLTVVRRSSSMMPIFRVFSGRPRASSTRSNSSTAKATSSGPCIFGFTMYTEPVRLLRGPSVFFRSCMAASTVIMASMMPSGISSPL